MKTGEIEALRYPRNPLDVLAQQVVACVAVDAWSVPALFDLVRGAYPYRDLSAPAFESVLKLVSGRLADRTGRFRPFVLGGYSQGATVPDIALGTGTDQRRLEG